MLQYGAAVRTETCSHMQTDKIHSDLAVREQKQGRGYIKDLYYQIRLTFSEYCIFQSNVS